MKGKIKIHINDVLYEAHKEVMTGAELKQLAGIPAANKLYKVIPGEAHPDEPIGDNQEVQLKNGDHFYDIPPGVVGQTTPLKSVEEMINKVKEYYKEVTVTFDPSGQIFIQVHGISLPHGWNKQKTDILVCLPQGFPTSKPNGFEADIDLKLGNGNPPQGGSPINVNGNQWLHFCWQPQQWDHSKETIWRYLKFAESRFKEIK